MARVRVSAVVDAPPPVVWDDIRRIDSHGEWMVDAESVRFTSAEREGVGVSVECDTRLGPFRLTDRIVVTEWEPRRRIVVRHDGVVSGEGAIRLARRPRRRTKVIWTERLRFPWWLGGPVGAWLAVPVLTVVWRSSMRKLAARFAAGELRAQPRP